MTKAKDSRVGGKNMNDVKKGMSRRSVLKGGAVLGAAAAVNMPFIRPSYAGSSLKVSTFGGYFEQSFSSFIYPAFTKATGIAVESVPQSESPAFLIQLQQASKAGAVPMDICCMPQSELLRGRELKLWKTYDLGKIPNASLLPDRYVNKIPSGVDGVGAMAWYTTFVVNKETVKPLPDSWKALWDPKYKNSWGLQSGGVSNIIEITSMVWFGTNDLLNSKEGIDKVIAKIAELKPNVKLWWEEEGTMQTALENDDVLGGTYYNDVAHTMAGNGTPVVSLFPKEGGVVDFGSWAQLDVSKKIAEAQAFINYTCTAEAQELMARHVGSVPLIDRAKMNLTQAEFDNVSSDVPPILVASEARLKNQSYMDQAFTKMLAG
ncbi:MAG: extracellular solute-binding protein [Parvibaculaceae bacterium]|nr:extracellular solute-binding protein [Parvibaculaceae bacterium]